MRLAKQCKMTALIEELENKCKQVYEFGKIQLPVNTTHLGIVCVFLIQHNTLRSFLKYQEYFITKQHGGSVGKAIASQ